MATHSSVLAWRIPGMGSLVGCLGGRTESDTTEATAAAEAAGLMLNKSILSNTFIKTVECIRIIS